MGGCFLLLLTAVFFPLLLLAWPLAVLDLLAMLWVLWGYVTDGRDAQRIVDSYDVDRGYDARRH